MHDTVPGFARFTFWVHLLVAVVLGLGLLVVPDMTADWFGFGETGEWLPVLRSFGALLLGFGAFTSYLGTRARSWEQVDFIVRAEIVYLALAVVVWLFSVVQGVGPAMANTLNLMICLVLLILFLVSWFKRPRI
ncbi:MAG: hypothetical protein ACYCYF_11065 [Anaerolineae bacterium]